MSWYYNSHDVDWDYDYAYAFDYAWVRTRASDIYPLEHRPFRLLVDAAVGYMETQNETPLYDSALLEFMDIAAGAHGSLKYERELKFHKFLEIPPEIRLQIYKHYLEGERKHEKLLSLMHTYTEEFNQPFGAWNWPHELTIRDRQSGNGLSTTKMAPWLPLLAFVNKQLLGEVTIHMLKTTDWFDILYESDKPFKIAKWFTYFLSSFPNYEAFKAIKRLNFPHAYQYNEYRTGKVIDEQNPDIQLMLRCPNLEIMAMTFNLRVLTNWWTEQPRDLGDFLHFFQIRPILEHRNIKQIHLEVNLLSEWVEVDATQMKCLEEFGRWIIEGFREKQNRTVDVYINKRTEALETRTVGEKVIV
jgi:hypothetical protein